MNDAERIARVRGALADLYAGYYGMLPEVAWEKVAGVLAALSDDTGSDADPRCGCTVDMALHAVTCRYWPLAVATPGSTEGQA